MAALEQKQKLAIPKLAQDLTAGTIGGWAQVVVGHSFDTIKVRMQTQPSPPIYKNGIDCFQQLVRAEGFKGLYRGVTSPLAGIGLCNAVVFMSNGAFRRMLQGGEDRPLTLGEVGLAGALAGSVMSFFNCPIELLKVKLQTQDPKGVIGANGKLEPPFKGVVDCGVRTVRAHGLGGIYRGLGITILRDFPSYGLYFITYEGLKRTFQSLKKNPEDGLTTADLLMAGGFAGLAAWIPAFPQDVIKSRVQDDPRIKNSREALRIVLRSGTKGLLNGIGPALARAFPANAATFFAYEMAMDAMSKM
ncbi:mitochondrial carrier domain-containing protein [Gongronella butleri]|nr:mitochondrial carrier domain-containing protein [Gongronella butleri]